MGTHATRWLIGLVLACALSAHALGAKPSPVEKLAADAAVAYRNGDYAKAADLLERAYQAQPVGTILYNLAKAYEKQGDNEKALDRYQRYLAGDDTDPKYKARAEARVAALKETLAPKPPPEKHEAPPPPPPVIVQPVAPPPPPVDDNWQRANRERRRDRGVAIGLGVTGVAALGAAIGLTVNAASLHDQFDATVIESDKRSLRDSAQTQLIVAGVLYGVGAAAIATASWFLYRGMRGLPPRRASLAPAIWARGGGVAVELRF